MLTFDPDPDTLIDPHALFPDALHDSAPIHCGEFLHWRVGKWCAYRRTTAQQPI